jgi:hypothetical protein
MGMSNFLNLKAGQLVEVTHDQGKEIGMLYSINYKSGKALIFAETKDCPHFFNANINQLNPCTN